VEIEQSGIPSVVITSAGFTILARLGAKAGGVDGLRLAEYPGTLGNHSPAEIEKNVSSVLFEQVIEGLTRPISGSTSIAANKAWDPGKIVFKGTLEEINEFFVTHEWADGLPIIPPTAGRIERFLEHCSYPRDKQIASLPSANLLAVPWNIAANAVMAGCKPEHMPIIIAAVEALADERASLNNVGSSSGLLPFLLINGPIIKDLKLEFGGQLISKGPNTAIGRAIGLIVRNIAGFRPGKTYMGTFGYPLIFALAENESESPWEPFHVDQGFNRSANTVTVGVTTNWGSSPEASSGPDNRSGAEVALELIAKEISSKARAYDFPTIGPKAEHVMITVLMSPSVAKCLAGAGYSKKGIADYLYQNARMSLRNFEWVTRYTYPASMTVAEKVQAGLLPEEFSGEPDKMVKLLAGPEIVHLVVCGDANRNRIMVLEGGHTRPTTKEIRFSHH
jgi:hypothetical protein